MSFVDIIRMAQRNLIRSKLRTLLTIVAVFIGALTISLTNGVGNGVRSYVDRQLGNVGVDHTLIVQAKQENFNPAATDVVEYDPNRTTGMFNVALLTTTDIEVMRSIEGVTKVTPQENINIDYVGVGKNRFIASTEQYIEGLNLELVAGRVVNLASQTEITIPERYVTPLGFDSPSAAVGQSAMVGFKNIQGVEADLPVTIVGVQQSSLLGNTSLYIGDKLAEEIKRQQSSGVPSLANRYQAALAQYSPDLTPEDLAALKKRFEDKRYQAMTIEDQLGTVSQVINSIMIALNMFGAIALLAASFGIVNTLLMAVNERTREIGLMKALGTGRRNIFTIFSVEAMSIGFWGALLGVLASIGVGALINRYASSSFLKDFEGFDLLAFPLVPSIGIIALIMFIAFVAGALPSVKASRLNPIDALRYE
jgi:putative ABC transport system permease protein